MKGKEKPKTERTFEGECALCWQARYGKLVCFSTYWWPICISKLLQCYLRPKRANGCGEDATGWMPRKKHIGGLSCYWPLHINSINIIFQQPNLQCQVNGCMKVKGITHSFAYTFLNSWICFVVTLRCLSLSLFRNLNLGFRQFTEPPTIMDDLCFS